MEGVGDEEMKTEDGLSEDTNGTLTPNLRQKEKLVRKLEPVKRPLIRQSARLEAKKAKLLSVRGDLDGLFCAD